MGGPFSHHPQVTPSRNEVRQRKSASRGQLRDKVLVGCPCWYPGPEQSSHHLPYLELLLADAQAASMWYCGRETCLIMAGVGEERGGGRGWCIHPNQAVEDSGQTRMWPL